MKKAWIVPVLVVVASGAFSAVLAQTVEGLDIGAIEERAAEQKADAQGLFDFATANAEVHAKEAQQVVDGSLERVKDLDVSDIAGQQGPIDLDEMLAGARETLAAPKGAPLFMAFASLSMPEEALTRMIEDTTRAGGVVVFRGFSAGNPKAFIDGIRKVVDREGARNIAIDPRLFRAFGVDRVPTYVALSRDFEPCDQLDCVSQAPPHDRLAGNVSAAYALNLFAESGGPGAAVSRVALNNMGGGR